MGSSLSSPTRPAFQNQFPGDILRFILEIAALYDISTCCALTLTCKQFQAWFEPILYTTVTLSHSHQIRTFKSTLSQRTSLQNIVKSLVFRLPVNIDPQLLTESCTSVESLYIDVDHIDQLRKVSIPSLRQFTICGPLAQTLLLPLPISLCITHIVFIGDFPRDLADDSFPTVTHFACHCRIRGEQAYHADQRSAVDVVMNVGHILHTMLQRTELQVLVLVLQDDAALELPQESNVSSHLLGLVAEYLADERVVLFWLPPSAIPTADLLQTWDIRHGSRWLEAERIVQHRQSVPKPLYSSL